MKETLHALFVLSFIIPLIIIILYGLKRFVTRPLSNKINRHINITHTLPIGAKERLLCVEIEGTRLLLGITPHAISTLHVFNDTGIHPSLKESS